jgi:hypothetical protein
MKKKRNARRRVRIISAKVKQCHSTFVMVKLNSRKLGMKGNYIELKKLVHVINLVIITFIANYS